MLVRFSSVKTESITMFGNDALQLIAMLGASSALPGAIGAADIPAAIKHLRQQLQIHQARDAMVVKQADADNESDRDPPVNLAVRAGPLLDILERASAGDAPVMWEAV